MPNRLQVYVTTNVKLTIMSLNGILFVTAIILTRTVWNSYACTSNTPSNKQETGNTLFALSIRMVRYKQTAETQIRRRRMPRYQGLRCLPLIKQYFMHIYRYGYRLTVFRLTDVVRLSSESHL